MYTEDDEKVTVKKDNSNVDYDDFYTSFNDLDDKDKKNDKKNSKKKDKKEPKKKKKDEEEEDYSDFYDVDAKNEEVIDDDKNNKKKRVLFILICFIIIAGIIALAFFVLGKKNGESVKGNIELTKKEIVLKVGATEYISYKVVDTEEEIKPTFASSNPNVATVDENGKITSVGGGESTITISFIVSGHKKEQKCVVKVEVDPTPTPVPVTPTPTAAPSVINLNLRFNNGSDGKWTNKDVTITVDANSNAGITSMKYALDCTGECKYEDVQNNKIIIAKTGTTKVKVIVKDSQGKEAIKEVSVKIDKEAPDITFNYEKNITSDNDIEICATCKDSLSGCKQSKVCKKFTSSKTNQTISVTDNAGNSTKSSVFNVNITKKQDPCSLKVSSDGTVTATLRESAKYYGFNSSYSGSNELSKHVTSIPDVKINASKAGESAAAFVKYYVLNSNGSGGMCYIAVIKECVCKDKNSTDPNCPATCTYRTN